MDAKALIKALNLQPLGFEGGWYRETLRSEAAEPTFEGLDRSLHTSILYMLTPDTRGLMHRLRYGEVYHFYMGDPVDLVLLHPGHPNQREGRVEHVVLGHDLAGGHQVQHFVPAGTWQGSRVRPGGRYGLMGTTMAPGFDLRDFELGDRDGLCESWPEARDWLVELTPDVRRTPRLELVAATRDLVHAELRSLKALAAGTRSRIAEGWPPPLHGPDRLHFTLAKLESGSAQRGWWLWYGLRRADRQLVAVAGFKGPPADGRVEIGYSLIDDARGHGLETELVQGLCAVALEEQDVRTVDLVALEEVSGLTERNGWARVSQSGEAPGIFRYRYTRS